MQGSSTWKPRIQRSSRSRRVSTAAYRLCNLYPLSNYKFFCAFQTWRATKSSSITRPTLPGSASNLHLHMSYSSRGTLVSAPNSTGMQTAQRSLHQRYTNAVYHSSGASSRCSASSQLGGFRVGGVQGARATGISLLSYALRAMDRTEGTCWVSVSRWYHTHFLNDLLTSIHRRATGARCLAAYERDTHLRAHRTPNGEPFAFCNVSVNSIL